MLSFWFEFVVFLSGEVTLTDMYRLWGWQVSDSAETQMENSTEEGCSRILLHLWQEAVLSMAGQVSRANLPRKEVFYQDTREKLRLTQKFTYLSNMQSRDKLSVADCRPRFAPLDPGFISRH